MKTLAIEQMEQIAGGDGSPWWHGAICAASAAGMAVDTIVVALNPALGLGWWAVRSIIALSCVATL